MTVSKSDMEAWLQRLLGGEPERSRRPLQEYLAAIPGLDSLADLPSGTPVLVRGDVDCKPGPAVGDGDIRLRSMQQTLQFGRQQGWKQIVFGHIGRKPEGSLKAVAARLGQILGTEVPLIDDWFDDATGAVSDKVRQQVAQSAPGSVLMLENTRKYNSETLLWKAGPDDAPQLAEKMAGLANEYAAKLADVYVHEALSAGSMDVSSVIAPAGMRRVALGKYAAEEFSGPMIRCLTASMTVFSGLKADKLDDLQAVIERGHVACVFVAGSLAMAMKKADAELAGREFSIGVSENEEFKKEPYFIPRSRIDQARQMLVDGRAKGIRFVLPVDFKLSDGRVVQELGPRDQQLDVGPASSEHFSQAIGEYIAFLNANPKVARTAFYNGVFGKFEDPAFAEGTKRFIPELKRLKDAGVDVFVGGGEGGKALEQFGQPDWATHVFTAGGTVLNALGSEPVPYLLALRMQAQGLK